MNRAFKLRPLVAAAQWALLGLALPALAAPVTPGSAVLRSGDGPPLATALDKLPAAADEGWWRESLGLARDQRLELTAQADRARADGQGLIRLDLRVLDAAGQPLHQPTRVLVETSLGALRAADASGQAPLPGAGLPSLQVHTRSGQATVWLQAPAAAGTAELRASSGAVRLNGEIVFLPERRPLVAVGVLEGVVQLNRRSRDAQAAEGTALGFEDGLRRWQRSSSDGERSSTARAAFYLKGTVDGDKLVTAAFDSDKPTQGRQFRDLDPLAHYPITGDASVRQLDAQSRSPLFLRVETDRSQAQLGDMNSAPMNPAQRLAAYPRSLTGLSLQHRADGLQLQAFAAHARLRQYVDEQPGRGLSGPYAIGRPDAVANSERIELLVRDRSAPALVLKRRLLTRFVDYDFEPFSGRVVFRQPVPSVDEQLNPISIRIAYEVEEGGSRHWVAGASVSQDLSPLVGHGLTVGAAYAKDNHPLAPYALSGVNAQLALGPRTQVQAEWAGSKGTDLVNRPTLDADGTALNSSPRRGQAARLELRHEFGGTQVRAQAARAGAGFQNSAAGLSPGREELGVQAAHDITPQWRVLGEVQSSRDRSGSTSDGAARTTSNVGVQWKMDSRLRLDVSLNNVREKQIAGSGGVLSAVEASSNASSLPGLGSTTTTSFGFAGTGLLASPAVWAVPGAAAPLDDRRYTSLRARLTGQVTPEFSLFGEHEQADGARQRSALGMEYRLDDKSRAYARHEFANSLTGANGLTGDGSRSHSTVLGLDTAYMQDGQLFTEYRLAGAQNGQDVATAIGARNLWRVSDGFAATTAVERQSLRAAGGSDQQAYALALGGEYTGAPDMRSGGKLEWRTSPLQHHTLASLGYDRKLSAQWAAMVRGLQMNTRGKAAADGQDETQRQLQLGLAWRDTETNRWHGLGRLEQRLDDRHFAPASGLTTEKRSTWMMSAHANWQPARAWTHSGQLAFKRVSETFGGVGGAASSSSAWNGSLLAARTVLDLNERWDLSAYGSTQQAQGTRLHGLGGEVGWRVVKNLWLSGGLTAGRYSDAELFAANQSWRGAHLRLRFKFDESIFERFSSR